MSQHKGLSAEDYAEAYRKAGSYRQAARDLGVNESSVRRGVQAANSSVTAAVETLETIGYSLDPAKRTPEDAWREHSAAFERKVSKLLANRWPVVQTRTGPYCVFHSTDEHLDDDATPLKLIEQDVRAARAMNAVMCHGGDMLNNWPLAGRLAKQWAEQNCTRPDALLRAQHFIDMFQPDVWTDGNHEEFNPYLADLISSWLPERTIRSEWTVNFKVETRGGRTLRAVMSHKFQKGSSWFHKAHGHIREMLEGEEADLLMDGHLHSDGVLDHTLPERGHSAVCVASAGYKVVDKYAARISHGGAVPKLRGRAHWMIVDPFCDRSENFITVFKSALQAEIYLNGMQNLRAI